VTLLTPIGSHISAAPLIYLRNIPVELEHDNMFHISHWYSNNNNSQYESHFRGVWGDPTVRDHTSMCRTANTEIVSNRPTKFFCGKQALEIHFVHTMNENKMSLL